LLILGSGLGGVALFGWLGASTALWSFYAVQMFYLVVIFSLFIDGVLLARKRKKYELKRYNKWYVYLPIVVLVVLTLQTVLTFRGTILGFDNYRMPAASMAPTLQPGDLIATDTRGYVIGSTPTRGQIITFRFPPDPTTIYTKRVVGLPGDHITYRDKALYVNDQPVAQSEIGPEINRDARGVARKVFRLREDLDGVSHDILLVPGYPNAEGEYIVPPGHLFVLGDNRDNSNDSRFWGMLPIENVLGEVTLIWYADDIDRITRLEDQSRERK
jgi:signal peptidase I